MLEVYKAERVAAENVLKTFKYDIKTKVLSLMIQTAPEMKIKRKFLAA